MQLKNQILSEQCLNTMMILWSQWLSFRLFSPFCNSRILFRLAFSKWCANERQHHTRVHYRKETCSQCFVQSSTSCCKLEIEWLKEELAIEISKNYQLLSNIFWTAFLARRVQLLIEDLSDDAVSQHDRSLNRVWVLNSRWYHSDSSENMICSITSALNSKCCQLCVKDLQLIFSRIFISYFSNYVLAQSTLRWYTTRFKMSNNWTVMTSTNCIFLIASSKSSSDSTH